jgi:hypothetical protein
MDALCVCACPVYQLLGCESNLWCSEEEAVAQLLGWCSVVLAHGASYGAFVLACDGDDLLAVPQS